MLFPLRLGLFAIAMTFVSLTGTVKSIISSLLAVIVRSAKAMSVLFSKTSFTKMKRK